jgi:hypothetical protein
VRGGDFDDRNRLHHVFGQPKHNLDGLVRTCGGRERAGQAIIEAVAAAAAVGELVVDERGMYSQLFDVAGHLVTISGRIVDGVPRIGDAWIA